MADKTQSLIGINRTMLDQLKFSKNQYIQFFVMLSFAMTFAVRSGTGYGAFPLLLIALISLPSLYQHFKSNPLTPFDKSLLSALTAFSLLMMLSVYSEGLSSRYYDKPVRYLLAAITLVLLLRYKVSLLSIALGAWLGSIFAGINALYDIFYLGFSRAGGRFTVVIEFGDISLILTSIVVLTYQQLKHRIPPFFIILSLLLGFTAVILSQSRGAWIFIPCLALISICHYRHLFLSFNKKKWLSLITFLAIGLITCWLSMGKIIAPRMQAIQEDISLYQSGYTHTSVGLRFEMWKGAIQTIKNAPLLGGGHQGMVTGKQQLADQGVIKLTDTVIQGLAAHNQYLDTWAKYGLFAFIALLAIFLIPLAFFINQRNKGDADTRSASYSGISLIIGYLFFALTESIFTISATVMFYSFAVIIIYSCAKTTQSQ